MHSRKRTARGRSTASRESGPPSGHEMDSPSLPLADETALLSSTRDRRLAAWLGAAAFLAVIAVFGCVLLLRRTGEPAPLIRPAPPGAVREGDLEALAGAVRRASRGLPYSQVLVTSRARAAF